MIRRRTPLKRSTKPIRARRGKARRGPAGIPPEYWRNPEYRRFLAERGKCYACEIDPPNLFEDSAIDRGAFGMDPMHGPVNGTSSKGPDAGPDGCIPGCRAHHEEQHRIGWPAFEAKYGFDRKKEALTWWVAFMIWQEANSCS